MLDDIKKRLMDFEITTITRQNFEQIFEVYDTNQEFFVLTQDKKATIDSSINDIDAIPPHCEIGQKIYVSIWKNGKVIGVMDLIERYPDKTAFWIGLLLIHGDKQGKKYGSRIINAVLNAAETAGYKSAQLGVIENNVKAINFWQKHGFNISGHSGNIVILERII
jgi:GNAT superfamily N-acetyltransferase